MAADVTNRETVRDEFASLIENDMTGTGEPVQAVYPYRVGDFGGQSPVMVVSGLGSERERRTLAERYRNHFFLTVYSFVIYADPDSDWGEDDAEDRLDLIEKRLADLIMDNNVHDGYWISITWVGRSERTDVAIGGKEYARELFTLAFEVYDG